MFCTLLPRVALPLLLLAIAGQGADAAEIDKYLPDDTNGVISLNLRQVIDSPLFKKTYLPVLQKELKAKAEIQKQLQDLGFDPFRDSDRLVLALAESCERQSANPEPGFFVIFHGRFDPARLHATLGQISTAAPQVLRIQKGTTGNVYELNAEGKSFFFAIPDKTTIVFTARKEPVAIALERVSGKKKPQLTYKDVQELITKTDGKQALWLVGTGRTALEFQAGFGNDKGKMVRKTLGDQGISDASGGFWLTENLKGAFAVNVQNAAAAKALSDALTVELAKSIEKGFDGTLDARRLLPVREFLKEMVIAGDGKHIVIQSEVQGRVFANSLK
jgi:hypothetical protein